MGTGISAGVKPSRLHRLERAYSFREIHHELKVAVDELVAAAEEDVSALCETHEVEASIEILLNDQYGLSELIMGRAAEFKDFFSQYVTRIKCYDNKSQVNYDTAIRCMQVTYKLLLCKLENEPDLNRTVYMAWRGLLELS